MLERRHVPTRGGHERASAQRMVELGETRPPVAPDEAGRPGPGERRPEVPRPEPRHPVCIARSGQEGGRPYEHLAVDPPCEVDSEKRQAWIRDGIHQRTNERPFLGLEPQVGAAEGDDAGLGRGARQHRQAIGPCAGAENGVAGLELAAGVADVEVTASRLDSGDLARERDPASCALEVSPESRRDRAVVDDPGAGGVQRRDAAHLRLDVRELLSRETPKVTGPVRPAAVLELVERRNLRLVDRDDHLPAALDGDPAAIAELVERASAAHAQARLQRARRVVDARMHDAGVVPGLVAADSVLLVEDDDGEARMTERKLARGRQPEDPGPDDEEVAALGRRLKRVRGGVEPAVGEIVQRADRLPDPCSRQEANLRTRLRRAYASWLFAGRTAAPPCRRERASRSSVTSPRLRSRRAAMNLRVVAGLIS